MASGSKAGAMCEPVLWLLGGLDPTGGAGLLRDWTTARTVAPAVSTRSVVTATTIQGHGAEARARPSSSEAIRFQLGGGPAPTVIKIGLVPSPLVADVLAFVQHHRVPTVVDPVLCASDGGDLGADPEALRPLLAAATLVTPNRDEARILELDDRLLGKNAEDDPEQVVDILVAGGVTTRFARPRHRGPDPRGTGCALATAIAAGLALGRDLKTAVTEAIAWLDDARTRVRDVGCDRAHLPNR